MPYNNSSCNNSYSQPSYPSYSHPYVHHQNAHSYNHGYPSQHPALTYPGYGYSGGYSGGYSAPRYASPSYASPSYGVPNVFSIIKTSPDTADDNVCALNSYDTLCLDSTGSENHLTITGDKTNKKVTFGLKNLIFGVADTADADETNYKLGSLDRLVTAPTADNAGVTIQTISTGQGIKVQSSLVKVKASGTGQTGITMEAGTIEGQKLTLVNVGVDDFDFNGTEATSLVQGSSDGTSNSSVAGEGVEMVWISDGTNSRWWVTSGLLS